jgi:hypothetical protein
VINEIKNMSMSSGCYSLCKKIREVEKQDPSDHAEGEEKEDQINARPSFAER